MASRKLRLTTFSRFLLVMLFLGPLAYFGASYYNGEDPVANIKKMIGIEEVEKSSNDQKETTVRKNNRNSDRSVDGSELSRLKEENESLKAKVRKQEQEIYKLKEDIINLKRTQ